MEKRKAVSYVVRIGDGDRILRLVRQQVERGLRYVTDVRLGSIYGDDGEPEIFEQIDRAVDRPQAGVDFSIIAQVEQRGRLAVHRAGVLRDKFECSTLRGFKVG